MQAESLLEASIGELRAAAQDFGSELNQLGFVKYLLGKEDAAIALMGEGITLQRGRMGQPTIAESLERYAWVATDRYEPHRAARLLGAAQALREGMNFPLPIGDRPLYDKYLAQARAESDAAAFDAAWAEGHALSLDGAIALAMT